MKCAAVVIRGWFSRDSAVATGAKEPRLEFWCLGDDFAPNEIERLKCTIPTS